MRLLDVTFSALLFEQLGRALITSSNQVKRIKDSEVNYWLLIY